MGRAGYVENDDWDSSIAALGWQPNVRRCLAGKLGQAFLWELYQALEALPRRELITGVLQNSVGGVCALGAVAVARGVEIPDGLRLEDNQDEDDIDGYEFAQAVGPLLGIRDMLAREVMYENDECGRWHWAADGAVVRGGVTHAQEALVRRYETPAERWQRMREWVVSHLKEKP
jgi:hypothetical protein